MTDPDPPVPPAAPIAPVAPGAPLAPVETSAPIPPPASPAPFARWLTIVGTIVIAGVFGGGLWLRHSSGIDAASADPLATFDAMIGRESVDEALPKAVAHDAEQSLRATIGRRDAKQATDPARGARERLAVVLGEQGRYGEGEALLTGDVSAAVFSRLVTCAYGTDRRGCDARPVCDEATWALLRLDAGEWSVTRACVVAAGRAHDTVTVQRLVPPPAPRVGQRLLKGVDRAGLGIGLAAVVIVFARRRRARPVPSDRPAPWPPGELYAAVVPCLLWTILLTMLVVVVGVVAKHMPGTDAVNLVFYLLGFWWMARLVFRRFGLSWRDSLAWPRPGARVDLALTGLAAIGLGRAGIACIGLVARTAGSHVPWSDVVQPINGASPIGLALSAASTVVMPALSEELLFRRVIFASLKRRYAPSTAAVASAILFALPHGYSWIGMGVILWLGLVTAWAFNRTGSLWPSIGAHAFSNAIALWASVM